VRFTLRFYMRAPADGPAPAAELSAAALDMAAWADERGCALVFVSEHHASPDGYLPSPLVLAAAIAGRTRRVPIQVAALLVPLHDPLRLAEDLAVLDLVSGGRVSVVCALGYRPEEYAMFGRAMQGRGQRLEESLAAMRRAWSGEPFEYEGRTVRVTPRPRTPGGPPLFLGGRSEIAARRAARLGLGLIAEGGGDALRQVYLEACRKAGRRPGLCVTPKPGAVTSAFVADDVELAWRELGPHLLHDATMYAAWMGEGHQAASKSCARSVDELRAERGAYRIFSPEEAIAHARASRLLTLQPLCGGIPPALAWRHLELFGSKVLPALRARA
jgi:alkanesulfonate monooxygenase SsuD/methylene tetrahydromethanopterin reductase-like flavin-dependent oxidoreductase (luciferase family)